MILTCINPTTLDLNDSTGFVAKIRIISPQSPPGSVNAQFGKTHFFLDTLYIYINISQKNAMYFILALNRLSGLNKKLTKSDHLFD